MVSLVGSVAARSVSRELKVLSAIAPDTQCVIRANWNCGTNKASWAKDVIKGWARVAKGGGLSFCVHVSVMAGSTCT